MKLQLEQSSSSSSQPHTNSKKEKRTVLLGQDFQKQVDNFDEIEVLYQKQRQAFLVNDSCHVQGKQAKMIEVKPDGNCLFS